MSEQSSSEPPRLVINSRDQSPQTEKAVNLGQNPGGFSKKSKKHVPPTVNNLHIYILLKHFRTDLKRSQI